MESRLVSDSYASLLAVVSTEGRYGSIIYKQYDGLQYHKVQKKIFDTVTIYLQDDKGEQIPFESGRVLVTLHLRKVNDVSTVDE